ncbi:unnamed protein product [Mytilus coruscus]|uniref:DED domain-containing protein n=1 Tax=Mytilus coruscus TaxID=42192 RepID=A0A6J8ADH4_MYTCO|nr:unnamed protein product [Mytilus coruscus]
MILTIATCLHNAAEKIDTKIYYQSQEMTKLDTDFQHLLYEISNRLGEEDVKSIKFILESNKKIPRQDLKKTESGMEIFALMEKYGLLSYSKTDELIQTLKTMKLEPCFTLIEDFNRENNEALAMAKEGPCNIKEDMVVEHFMETSKLKELEEKMATMKFITLSGFLGSGKSQLALKYACHQRLSCKNGICWKISCKDKTFLLNSLKTLADSLGLQKESKQNESISSEESIDLIHELIIRELKLKDTSIEHLIIFDDVTDETKDAVEKFKYSLLKFNVKVIITTLNQALCGEDNLITVIGFTENEAVQFLKRKDELTDDEVKDYKELAKYLSYLPLALYGVKTRMESNKLTPKGFLKTFKGRKSIIVMDKLLSSKERKIYEMLTNYLNILKKDEVEEVFDMVLILQFLSLEDIPILLFQFLPAKEGEDEDKILNPESFIEAIQKFSFGYVRSEDDDRSIWTHQMVIKTIDRYTSVEDKVRLLKKVLKALMWLLDKDNIHEKDYKRNQDLHSHAILVIRHYETLKKDFPECCKDFELNILVAYVYDLVGYTYNFFGMLKNAGEHSSAAKRSCFAITGMDETQIEDLFSQKCVRDENYETWEDFAKLEAEHVFDELKKVIAVPTNKELLQKMALDYNLNTHRSQGHIELLQEYLKDPLTNECTLTKSEYDQLCKHHLAIPADNHLGELFIYELFIQVFYTFGRRIFYLGDHVDENAARNFSHSLFLAREFGIKVAEECKQWDLPDVLYVMLTELSGTLEQIFDDRAKLGLKTLQHLDNAASRFKDLQEFPANYFVMGVIKSGPESLQHRNICLKRLVRCYTAMAHLISDDNEEKKTEISEKLHQCNVQLEKLSSQWSYRQTGADLRMGECFLVLKEFEEAEKKFLKVAPGDMHEDTNVIGQSVLNFHERLAVKGLIKVFNESGKKDKAQTLAKRLEARLENSNELEELSHFRLKEKDAILGFTH